MHSFRTRSDPAIHMNMAMSCPNATQQNFSVNQQQMWQLDYRQNAVQNSQSSTIPTVPVYSGPYGAATTQFQTPQSQPSCARNPMHFDTDMSVGSLPNMHSGASQLQHQNNYPTTSEISNQPMYSAVPMIGNNQVNRNTMPCFPQQQLSTPSILSQSQSAPTSPAQTSETHICQQWPTTRHYSASPDVLEVPNICVTGADGSENLDCFQVGHKNTYN